MKRIGHPWLAVLVALGVSALLLSACNRQATAASVDISLDEWAIAASPSTVSAGSVTFEVSNRGTETHEFVIIKTDLGLLDLPVGDDQGVDEEGEGTEIIDEVEDLAAGASETLTVDLSAGSYVLICNIVEEEDMEGMDHGSHYQMGMRTTFTVT